MNNNSRIDAVFARATDFEIVEATTSAIEGCYGFETILQRSPRVPFDRWVVHTVSTNTGLFEAMATVIFGEAISTIKASPKVSR